MEQRGEEETEGDEMSKIAEKQKITGLAPWFGGKRAMASMIVDQVCWRDGKPWTPAYFAEPFFGSGAVSFAMPNVPAHIINDLHRDLINLACVLASGRGEELLSSCQRTMTCEHLYKESIRLIESVPTDLQPSPVDAPSDEHLEWAWAFVVSSWLGANGQIGLIDTGIRFAKRWGPGGGDPATRLRSYAESMPMLMERLRRFTIHNQDAIELIGKIQDTPKTALYIDSPYLDATRTSGKYLHDFSDAGGATMFGVPDDHQRLADALNRFEHARVVVSYEDHPRLSELYPSPKWTKLVIDRPKNLSTPTGAPSRVSEVLIVNGDIRTGVKP